MNINNIKNLIRAYFYENWQKDLYNFGLAAAFAFLCMAFRIFDHVVAYSAIVALMVIYPLRLFGKLHQPSSRIHYLMVPATNGEKVLTGILLTNVYFLSLVFISATIGVLAGYGVLKLTTPELSLSCKEMVALMWPSSGSSFMVLVMLISVVFFGAIYFKKSPAWKIILVSFVIFLGIEAIMSATEFLNVVMTVPAEIRHGNYVMTESYVTSPSSKWFRYAVLCAITVYFYAMSFLRMRETEA